MRLLRQIGKLEEMAAAGAARVEEPAPIGIAWVTGEERIDAAGLQPGQLIAADIHILGRIGGVPEWHVRERVTAYAWDLGLVYDGAGLRIGRVTSIDGQMVEWRRELPE